MDLENNKITQLFASSFFRIPNYQRGYAWGDKQLTDLWDDIMDIRLVGETYRPHFTGSISLQKIKKEQLSTKSEQSLCDEGDNFYYVVDGQQRLTTISILLYVLIQKIKDSKESRLEKFIYSGDKPKIYRLGYCGSDENNQFLKNVIFEDSSESATSKGNIYTHNLLNAKKFFQNKLDELTENELKDFYKKLVSAVFFDIKNIDSNFDVQAVFETMNNRGKPLTTLEKLKNRLMFLASKLDIEEGRSEDLVNCINRSWGQIYEWMGKNPGQLLNEDEYLSAHLTLKRIPADYSFSETVAEQKVFEMFCNHAEKYNLSFSRGTSNDSEKEKAVNYDKIRDYALDICSMTEFWYHVNFPLETEQNKSNPLLYKILLLNGTKEMKIFLMQLMSLRQEDPAGIDHCLELVLKVLMRNSVPGAALMDERTFATKARDLHLQNTNIEEVNKELREALAVPCDKNAIIDSFRNLFNYLRGGIGFYRWRGLKYLLFEYEYSLCPQKDFPRILWEKYEDTSIEHIMPRTWQTYWSATMESYWKPKDLEEEEKQKASNILINSLGNLSIIRDIKNSGLGNNPWESKKEAYKRGSYSEEEIAREEKWNEDSIYKRGKRMFAFLCQTMLGQQIRLTEEDYTRVLFYDSKFLGVEEEPTA